MRLVPLFLFLQGFRCQDFDTFLALNSPASPRPDSCRQSGLRLGPVDLPRPDQLEHAGTRPVPQLGSVYDRKSEATQLLTKAVDLMNRPVNRVQRGRFLVLTDENVKHIASADNEENTVEKGPETTNGGKRVHYIILRDLLINGRQSCSRFLQTQGPSGWSICRDIASSIKRSTDFSNHRVALHILTKGASVHTMRGIDLETHRAQETPETRVLDIIQILPEVQGIRHNLVPASGKANGHCDLFDIAGGRHLEKNISLIHQTR